MLYLAGTILLWHNFVPHNHEPVPAEIFKSSTQERQHDHSHHHGISHSHHQESNDEQNTDDPLNVPSHFQTVGDAVVKQTINRFGVILPLLDYTVWRPLHLSSPDYIQLFLIPLIPEANRVLKSPYNSSRSLRGPPFQIFS